MTTNSQPQDLLGDHVPTEAVNTLLIAVADLVLSASYAWEWLNEAPDGTQQREIADELRQAIARAVSAAGEAGRKRAS